jgi:hypothetical protein
MSKDDSRPPSPHECDLARLRSITSCEQLLAFCKDKKAGLAPAIEGRNMAAVNSISLLREVWAAMDRIGCVVPPRPPLLRVDELRAFSACLLEEEGKYPHPEDALDAYSTAIAWCAGQIAAGPDRAETGQAEGTVAGEVGKARDDRDPAEAEQAEGAGASRGPVERVGTVSDHPIRKLKERAAQEARQQEAERQRQELFRHVERECDRIRFYGERAGTENDGSNRGLAEQIARFLAAVRAVGWWNRFETLQPNDNPAWTIALDIYRRCAEGDIDGATAKLNEAEAIGQSWARAGITDALMRIIPDAILSPPFPSENAGEAGQGEGAGPGRDQAGTGQATLADPRQCPGCGTALSEHQQLLPSFVCPSCRSREYQSGILSVPVAGPPGTPPEGIAVHEPIWTPIDPGKLAAERAEGAGADDDPTAAGRDEVLSPSALSRPAGLIGKGRIVSDRTLSQLTRFDATLQRLLDAARGYLGTEKTEDVLACVQSLFAEVQLTASPNVTIPPFRREIWPLDKVTYGPASTDGGKTWQLWPSYNMLQRGNWMACKRWMTELEGIAEAVRRQIALQAEADPDKSTPQTEQAEWAAAGNKPAEREQAEGSGTDDGHAEGASAEETWVFTQSGDGYFIAVPEGQGHFAGLKGFGQILQLIRSPTGTVPMRLLVSDAGVAQPGVDRWSRQPTIGPEGFEQIRTKRQELKADLAKAQKDNNLPEADRIRAELEELDATVTASMGLSKMARDLNNDHDRLRPTIHASLKRAYDALRKGKPPLNALAEHFELSIFSESGCFVYRPSPRPYWRDELPEKM